jgi:hypothetical protein
LLYYHEWPVLFFLSKFVAIFYDEQFLYTYREVPSI